jgi:hypothetical protein
MLSYFSTAHNQQLYAHAPKNGFTISSCHHIHHWLVVWNMIFIFPCIGNHPPDWLSYFSEGHVHHQPVAIMLYLHYDTFDTVKNDVYIIYICMYIHALIIFVIFSSSHLHVWSVGRKSSHHLLHPPMGSSWTARNRWVQKMRYSKDLKGILINTLRILYVFMICEQMYDNWHSGYVHEVVYLCLFSGTLCPSGS